MGSSSSSALGFTESFILINLGIITFAALAVLATYLVRILLNRKSAPKDGPRTSAQTRPPPPATRKVRRTRFRVVRLPQRLRHHRPTRR
ncbi:hypothetical protein [Haloglycomyces albus]|uniref:hypothetical protein n=1 Tax=Haloglycomyces albus TaxID=526067 RepID=UPI0012EBDDDA|nr:hypothetical protein [Haloglycomyces albus]